MAPICAFYNLIDSGVQWHMLSTSCFGYADNTGCEVFWAFVVNLKNVEIKI